MSNEDEASKVKQTPVFYANFFLFLFKEELQPFVPDQEMRIFAHI